MSLANVASGVILILLRPFRVGDIIEAQGTKGTVEKINFFNVILKTVCNESVIIPNAKLTADKITNFSARNMRRIEVIVGISYDANVDQACAALLAHVTKLENVLNQPEPQVFVSALADSSVNLSIRVWASKSHVSAIKQQLLNEVYKCCLENNINIPYPHIRLIQH